MKIITLPNIDSKIWNLEFKIIEIISKLLEEDSLVIDLNHEGPCAESLNLYKILDDICEKFKIDSKRIIIQTSNPLEKNKKYVIRYSSQVWLAKYPNFKFDSNKIFDQTIRHFGIFIARGNWNRLFLASTIFKNFKQQSIMSFHCNLDSNVNRGFDELCFIINTPDSVSLCYDLLKEFPIKLDEVKKYPVVNPEHLNILQYYNNIFLDVICETYFTGNTFFPTEKTARPLIAKTPFLLFGPKDYLSNLKKLGFKTFNNYWSEEYDRHAGLYRAKEIEKILLQISKKSIAELEIMYNDMLPILDHNKNLLNEITVTKYYDTFK